MRGRNEVIRWEKVTVISREDEERKVREKERREKKRSLNEGGEKV